MQLARLIQASDPRRFKHVVVGLSPEGLLASRMRRAGAKVLSLDLEPSLIKGVGGLVRLASIIRRQRPHLVQGWMYHANLMGLLAARLAGSYPVVWGIRCTDMEFYRYRQGTRVLVQVCARLSSWPSAIVSNSRRGLEFHARRGYPAAKMRVVHNGIRVPATAPDPAMRDEMRRRLGVGPDDLLVGHVARFDPMKDHANLMAAAQVVARQDRRAHFVLMGLGVDDGNPVFEPALNLPLAGRCHLLGRQAEVTPWLAAMDLHVSSSAFGEGLSNAVGEAMALQVPNVVTDLGDNRLLVGDTGLVVPPRRPERLAEAILSLLGMPAEDRAAMGAQARERIREHFSQEVMARAFESIYQELLSKEPWGKTRTP
ncbi:MAG: glycosyltransferase [Desulfarculaceae bacterium]|nr:glycosyltransferase [Desulfarculaceae bacterium]MCF8072914.1 glycosyltransferase [Desulfarculaceae bacterium]MCF8101082.1 glycosyltransferase [Desulfarculaceae bacterium]MCF8115531.1 glycosyltransferase [Desulfarculaceae bacterium]